jgi:hypothetical protein
MGPEPSLGAERRVRELGPDDWGWAHRRRPAGRTAIWIGVAVTATATALGVAFGPLGDRLDSPPEPAPVHEPAPEPLAGLAGTWRGTFDGNAGTIVLHGPLDALRGDVTVRLGQHELRSRIEGRYDAGEGVVVLVEATGSGVTYVAVPSRSGLILEGQIERPDLDPAPFAVVRTE